MGFAVSRASGAGFRVRRRTVAFGPHVLRVSLVVFTLGLAPDLGAEDRGAKSLFDTVIIRNQGPGSPARDVPAAKPEGSAVKPGGSGVKPKAPAAKKIPAPPAAGKAAKPDNMPRQARRDAAGSGKKGRRYGSAWVGDRRAGDRWA